MKYIIVVLSAIFGFFSDDIKRENFNSKEEDIQTVDVDRYFLDKSTELEKYFLYYTDKPIQNMYELYIIYTYTKISSKYIYDTVLCNNRISYSIDKSFIYDKKRTFLNDCDVMSRKLQLIDFLNTNKALTYEVIIKNINNIFYGYWVSYILYSFAGQYSQKLQNITINRINEGVYTTSCEYDRNFLLTDIQNIESWLGILNNKWKGNFVSNADNSYVTAYELYCLIENLWSDRLAGFICIISDICEQYSDNTEIHNIQKYFLSCISCNKDRDYNILNNVKIEKIMNFVHNIQVVCTKSAAVSDSIRNEFEYRFESNSIKKKLVASNDDFIKCMLFYAYKSGITQYVDLQLNTKTAKGKRFDCYSDLLEILYSVYFEKSLICREGGSTHIEKYLCNCIQSIFVMAYAYMVFDISNITNRHKIFTK